MPKNLCSRMVGGKTTFDPLHHAVGDFGRWQAGISVLMALLKMPIAWFQLSILILEAPVPYWCVAPGRWNNDTKPMDACSVYHTNDTTVELGNYTSRGVITSCTKWEYNRDVFTENIVTQWNLVCGRSYLSDIAQATFMCGVLLGNVVFGMAADRFGRKLPLMTAIAAQAVCGIASSFMTWFSGFIIFRFLLAIATGGTMIISFVLIMEIVGDSWRTLISILYQIPFCFGIIAMSGVSYLQRDWRHFQLTLSLLSGTFLLYWWFVPESPRWLLAVGREKEAALILERAARWNGRDVASVRKALQQRSSHVSLNQVNSSAARKANLLDLLRTPNLRRYTLCLFCLWFLCGLSFFGLSQAMGHLGGNIFLTVVLAGVISLPGIILTVYSVKMGRRRSIICSQVAAGVACLLIVAVPRGMFVYDWPRMVLSAVALTSVSMSFPALYLFSGEIFPTVVRNVGLGSASMFSRVGSILAPFIKSTGMYYEFLPMLIIGTTMLAGAFFMFLLPETEGCRLPDTLQDGEQFGKRSSDDRRNANYLPVPMDQMDAS